MGKWGSALGKQNLRVTCPMGKVEFKYFSSPDSKATPRSVKVRLRSNVLIGFGKEEAFLSTWIVTLFRTMAVKVKRMFKTQLTM